jgi:hypothetical protein
MQVNMERWWNDTDGGRQKYSEKNLSQSQLARKIFHMVQLEIESGAPHWEGSDLTA